MQELIVRRIRQSGPLPVPDFLQLALYHPAHGYYARGASAVGKAGDFFTSVSVGPVFGHLLAARFHRWWLANERPPQWRIVELGAHDGSLAADVLAALRETAPDAFAALEYAIPEPLPALAACQQERLAIAFPAQFRPHSLAAMAANPLPGVAFANELIDALPFHVVRFTAGQWHERHVVAGASGALGWLDLAPSHPQLGAFCDCLGSAFPDGYTTEVRLGTDKLLGRLAATLTHGLLCLIDYGFPAVDYYHPARTTGTLRTFARHRAAEDPLDAPGSQDITAHVDFSALLGSGIAAGLAPHLWADQGRYLTTLAHAWLLSLENAPQADRLPLVRQFQTLTHPAHLGARFHVLEMLKATTEPGFSLPGGCAALTTR